MKKLCLFLLVAVIMLLLGCDSAPEKSASAAGASQQKQTEVQTGRFALQKMIAPARLWAADAQPIRMTSSASKDNLGHNGQSGFWQTTFASPARQRSEGFSWSGLVGPDAPQRGVDHSSEDSFNPGNRSTQPFDLAFLKVDSNQAFDMAQQHGGKQVLEKNPNQEVVYILDWDPRTEELRWHVIYGNSPNNSQLTVIVNAATGGFMHKE